MTRKSSPRQGSTSFFTPQPLLSILAAGLLLILGVAAFLFWPRPESPEPTPTAVFMPAEFSPQADLLLGGVQLVDLHPDVLSSIVRAAAGDIRIRILAGSTAERRRIESVLADNSLALSTVDILELPIMTMWVRDFGPLTLSDADGRRILADFHYRERRGNAIDDEVPGHLARDMGLDLRNSPLLLEGGDLLTNGLGFCVLSTRVVNRNAHYLDLEPRQTVQDLAAVLGFDNLTLAPPLQGESTGHVDMFCVFLEPDLILVGSYEPAVDPENAAQLDQVAENLALVQTLVGPLRVERLPMPDHDDGVWRTHTNVVFANGVLLVPVYSDYCPEMDEAALSMYRRLLPDRRVVGIDASRLIKMKGALRCITMNVPSGLPAP